MNQAAPIPHQGPRQLDETKAFLGLTPKQYAYCDARAAGMRQSEAYRQAYDAEGMAPDDVRLAAWRLEQDSRIPQRINNLLNPKEPQTSLVPRVERIEVSKDFVVQGIAQIAVDKTVKANTRLSAYVHLGKVNGVDAFRDIVVHEKRTRTVEEIDLEIARHLANMIDVTPNAPGSSLPVIDQAPPAPAARDRRRKPVT